nr:recombinase family protein [Desulfovibrio sp. ZJ200]
MQKDNPMEQTYGYIRVSSVDQNEIRQRIALEQQAIPPDRIFMDKMSGKDFHRPQYQAMLKKLRPGDLLCITSIDRLGRNYEEILEQWRVLTREKRVDILVLDMPLLDTRRDKNLLGTFIADLVLQVLSFVAQNERENIRNRQAEGIAAAKQRGVRFGHEPRPLPPNFPETYVLWTEGVISTSEAAKRSGMARSTFRTRAESFKKDCP